MVAEKCSIQFIQTSIFFIVLLGRGTLWHLQKSLQCIRYIILEFFPSTILLFSPCPHSWNSFNRNHFSIYVQEYTAFVLSSPSHTLSPHPSPSYNTDTKKNDIFVCLVLLHRESPCDISKYIVS
jgi:hypothetical protein